MEVKLGDFYNFTDFTSQQTLNKIVPRPYLSDMVFVRFSKGVLNFDGEIL